MNGSLLLGCLSVVGIVPIYIFYKKGKVIRAKSKFAERVQRHKLREIQRMLSQPSSSSSSRESERSRTVAGDGGWEIIGPEI